MDPEIISTMGVPSGVPGLPLIGTGGSSSSSSAPVDISPHRDVSPSVIEKREYATLDGIIISLGSNTNAFVMSLERDQNFRQNDGMVKSSTGEFHSVEDFEEVQVRRANGDPLSVWIPNKQILSFTVGMLKPLVAYAIGAPAGVTTILDVDSDELLKDEEIIVEIFSDRDKMSEWVPRCLLVVVKNVHYEEPLANVLGKRSNTEEDVKIIVYQMANKDLNQVTNGETFLQRYTREERLPIVNAFLDAVPRFEKINHVNQNGETALHIACYIGNAQIVEKILSSPYFFNHGYLDKCENTAFHYCVFQNNNSIKRLFSPVLTQYMDRFPQEKLVEETYFNSLDAIIKTQRKLIQENQHQHQISIKKSRIPKRKDVSSGAVSLSAFQSAFQSHSNLPYTTGSLSNDKNIRGFPSGVGSASGLYGANKFGDPSAPTRVLNHDEGAEAMEGVNQNGKATHGANGVQVTNNSANGAEPGPKTPSVNVKNDTIDISSFNGQLVIDGVLYSRIDGVFQPVSMGDGSLLNLQDNLKLQEQVVGTAGGDNPDLDNVGDMRHEGSAVPQNCNEEAETTSITPDMREELLLRNFNIVATNSYNFSLFTKEEFNHVLKLALGDAHCEGNDEVGETDLTGEESPSAESTENAETGTPAVGSQPPLNAKEESKKSVEKAMSIHGTMRQFKDKSLSTILTEHRHKALLAFNYVVRSNDSLKDFLRSKGLLDLDEHINECLIEFEGGK